MGLFKPTVVIFMAMWLAACGGGGGSTAVPAQQTPTTAQVNSMIGVYTASITTQENLLTFLTSVFPVSAAGFTLNNVCPYGGTATLNYQDNNDSQVSTGDSYTITFSDCVTLEFTYTSGSILADITDVSATTPNFNSGIGVFTTDWSIAETVSFSNLRVVDNATFSSSSLLGALDVSLGNDLTLPAYHAILGSSNLQADNLTGGNASTLQYASLSLAFNTDTATNAFTLDHDFSATYTSSGTTQQFFYTNEPPFSGTAAFVGDTESAPTTGSLLIEWSGYQQVTLVAQPDELNVAVDIVGDNAPVSLVPWASLGFF